MTAREIPNYHTTVTQHLSAVLRSERAATDYILSTFNPEDLGYRVINKDTLSSGGCVLDIGLFSRGQGSGAVWQRERFREHCGGRVMYPPSPYMSISTSPRRILNILPTRGSDAEVAIIDMKMLRIMNPHHRSTTDIAAEFGLKSGPYQEGHAPYVTDTHYLVYEYIHQSCIMGFVAAADFEQICRANEIGTSIDNGFDRILRWPSLKPYSRKLSTFRTDPDFVLSSVSQSRPAPAIGSRPGYGAPAQQPVHLSSTSSSPPYTVPSSIDDLANSISSLGISSSISQASAPPIPRQQATYTPSYHPQAASVNQVPPYEPPSRAIYQKSPPPTGQSPYYESPRPWNNRPHQTSQWHPQNTTYLYNN